MSTFRIFIGTVIFFVLSAPFKVLSALFDIIACKVAGDKDFTQTIKKFYGINN